LTYSSFDEYDAKRLAHIGSDVPVIWSKMWNVPVILAYVSLGWVMFA
jgi:hypothetical protein